MFGLIGQLIGILLIIFGGFLVFFFPAYSEKSVPGHQPLSFGVSGIVIGLISLVFGFILLFY